MNEWWEYEAEKRFMNNESESAVEYEQRIREMVKRKKL